MKSKVKSPNKHTSLTMLLEIQLNNYIGRNGQEYHDTEIDLLIFDKENKKMIAQIEIDINRYNEEAA